jgi:hypothetical protein
MPSRAPRRSRRLLHEYFHSGNLLQLEFGDVNHDGRMELYASGVSNARQQGTLVVLDPETMHGASAEDEDYQLLNMGTANEIARVFFPRTDLSRAAASYNTMVQVLLMPDGIDVTSMETGNVTAGPTVAYTLTPLLGVRDVGASDYFVREHNRLVRGHEWSSAELAELRHISVLQPKPNTH